MSRLKTLRYVIERIERLNKETGSFHKEFSEGVFTMFGKPFFATNVIPHRNSDNKLMIHNMKVTYFDNYKRREVACPALTKTLIEKFNEG